MRLQILALALALPASAVAQQLYPSNAMTEPVTPRDIPYYMAHQDVLALTLQACHSNAAYGPTADCQNAERASVGSMAKQKQRAAGELSSSFFAPEFWDQNPIMRATILTQCHRRGPGDEIAYPFCKVAAASQMRSLNR